MITKNRYEDVTGSPPPPPPTGLHMRFGGGYLLDEISEVRVTFTLQSLDADLTPMGDIGAARLYGQYDDYQTSVSTWDSGAMWTSRMARAYGEGTVGLGFVDETDLELVAPAVNVGGTATDFYDRTTAFSLGGNVGVLMQISEHVGLLSQIGLRWVSGMSAVDGLEGTGLEDNKRQERPVDAAIPGRRPRPLLDGRGGPRLRQRPTTQLEKERA